MMKDLIKIVILFVIIILLLIFIPNLNVEYIKTSKLYINEICASNQSIIRDEDNEYVDYIELYNGYDYDIDLSGYYLSDSEFATSKWMINDISIKSKDYVLIYASGKNRIGHANFKLSSDGEVLTLSDKNGNIISKFSYPKMNPNDSYGFYKDRYGMMNPSPLKENSMIITNNKEVVEKRTVIINEYMSRNKSYNYDKYGNYYDWIELKNVSDKDINLNKLYLSDNSNNLTKFEIPYVTIKKDGYLLIYLSGKKNKDGDNIYANFKITDNEEIVLSDGKNIIDKVNVVNLRDNISYGRVLDKWYYFTSPTPGKVNDTAYFMKLEEYNGSS